MSGAAAKVEIVRLADLRPAPYNPRKITPEQFGKLKESLSALGCCVPVLVNRANNVIIAGHQRTKAMLALGWEKCPAFFVDGMNKGDEMLYNQFHNGVEKRSARLSTCAVDGPTEQFVQLSPSAFKMGDYNAVAAKQIGLLLHKYQNVLACVVCNGKVYLGAGYVAICRLLNYPVNTYIAPPELEGTIQHYFGLDYGTYNYDQLEKHTYIQGMAQPRRNPNATDKRANKSTLYEGMVLPYLHKTKARLSLLDFGCGEGAYCRMLAGRCKPADPLEFFPNNHAGRNCTRIFSAAGNAMIDRVAARVASGKRYDVVVCDKVLNSVDSMDAERSVVRCCNAFFSGADDGRIFISGRTVESALSFESLRKNKDHRDYLHFFDENYFTAKFRAGEWFYQHFHTHDGARACLEAEGLEIVNIVFCNDTWMAECRRARELTKAQMAEAVNFEFNLPLPQGKRYNRHGDVLAAFAKGGFYAGRERRTSGKRG